MEMQICPQLNEYSGSTEIYAKHKMGRRWPQGNHTMITGTQHTMTTILDGRMAQSYSLEPWPFAVELHDPKTHEGRSSNSDAIGWTTVLH